MYIRKRISPNKLFLIIIKIYQLPQSIQFLMEPTQRHESRTF